MINHEIVQRVDAWLDAKVGADYVGQPLAQDWARVAKGAEEAGEAIAELIILTGQNPRKPQDSSGAQMDRFLAEMADAAMTFVYGIQHFTKDPYHTERILKAAQAKHIGRASNDD